MLRSDHHPPPAAGPAAARRAARHNGTERICCATYESCCDRVPADRPTRHWYRHRRPPELSGPLRPAPQHYCADGSNPPTRRAHPRSTRSAQHAVTASPILTRASELTTQYIRSTRPGLHLLTLFVAQHHAHRYWTRHDPSLAAARGLTTHDTRRPPSARPPPARTWCS